MERITNRIHELLNKLKVSNPSPLKESIDYAIGLPVEAKDVVDSQDRPMYQLGDRLYSWDELGDIGRRIVKDSIIEKVIK